MKLVPEFEDSKKNKTNYNLPSTLHHYPHLYTESKYLKIEMNEFHLVARHRSYSAFQMRSLNSLNSLTTPSNMNITIDL